MTTSTKQHRPRSTKLDDGSGDWQWFVGRTGFRAVKSGRRWDLVEVVNGVRLSHGTFPTKRAAIDASVAAVDRRQATLDRAEAMRAARR